MIGREPLDLLPERHYACQRSKSRCVYGMHTLTPDSVDYRCHEPVVVPRSRGGGGKISSELALCDVSQLAYIERDGLLLPTSASGVPRRR